MNQKETKRKESKEELKRLLLKCFVVRVEWISGRPTSTGRSDKLNIIAVMKEGDFIFLNRLYCSSFGYRISNDEFILMDGCGYSKSHHVYTDLMKLLNRSKELENQNPTLSYE